MASAGPSATLPEPEPTADQLPAPKGSPMGGDRGQLDRQHSHLPLTALASALIALAGPTSAIVAPACRRERDLLTYPQAHHVVIPVSHRRDRSSRILITGDVIVHAVQVVNPEVTCAFEQDPARESRRSLLEMARCNEAELASAHLTIPLLSP